MHKIFAVLFRAFKQQLEYRFELVIWFLIDAIPLLVIVIIWSNIYQNQENYGGYSLAQMLWYYFLALIISTVTSAHFEEYRFNEIRNGKIDFYLLRPWSFVKEIWFSHLGGKLLSIIIKLPLLLIIYLHFKHNFETNAIIEVGQLLAFIFAVIVAFLIQSLISTLLTLAGFWFESGEALENFKWIFISLFSGAILPVNLMPSSLAKIINLLPLKYLYAVPIGIIQGKYQLKLSDVIFMSCFVFLLLILVQVIQEAGRKVYASSGG